MAGRKKSFKIAAAILISILIFPLITIAFGKAGEPSFIIRGTVTDAETGKPIAGAKVGDTEKYADGKFFAITNANGNYSYKTYYEEHILKCRAGGYKDKTDILLVKLLGEKEKEKVLNFELKPKGADKQESPDVSRPAVSSGSETGEKLQKAVKQNKADNETNKASKTSGDKGEAKKARALRVRIYEGEEEEPETDIAISLTAVKILRQILPSKEKLQVIAKSIELEESLPEDVNSAILIDILDETLKQLDEGIEATTLVEVKNGDERIVIALE